TAGERCRHVVVGGDAAGRSVAGGAPGTERPRPLGRLDGQTAAGTRAVVVGSGSRCRPGADAGRPGHALGVGPHRLDTAEGGQPVLDARPAYTALRFPHL